MNKPDVIRIQEELAAMPEFRSVQDIQRHAQTYYIFERNARELLDSLALHADAKATSDLWIVDNRDKLYAVQLELGRLLHNFAAASSSLIDITRVLYNRYETSRFPDYQPKIDSEFKNDPLAQFIVGMRQYVLHYSAPPLKSTMHMDMMASPISTITIHSLLSSSELLKFGGWGSKAKKYISDSGDDVILDHAASQYFDKVRLFYEWFYGRLNEIHKPDLDRVAEKQEEWQRAHYANAEWYLGIGLSDYNRDKGSPDSILRRTLAPDDLQKVMAISDPVQRLDAALCLLLNYIELPHGLIDILRFVFSNHAWPQDS